MRTAKSLYHRLVDAEYVHRRTVLALFLYSKHPLLITHGRSVAGWTFNLTQPDCSHVFNRADIACSVLESSHAISPDSSAVEVLQCLGKGIALHSLLFIHVGRAQAPVTASYWIACTKIKIRSKSHRQLGSDRSNTKEKGKAGYAYIYVRIGWKQSRRSQIWS